MRIFTRTLAAVATASVLVLSGCGSGSGTSPSQSPSGGSSGSAPAAQVHIAGVFSGSVTDAGFTENGLLALNALKAKLGANVSYSQNVAVPDAADVMRQYIASGNTIIWSHGGQFHDAVVTVAKESPNVVFIDELDQKPTENLPNVWTVDRNFYTPFYVAGYLAGKVTKSNKIAYVGGLPLPFMNAELHAVKQALTDEGSAASFTSGFTGDYNDPTKAQQLTAQFINQGADVILGSLDLGQVGVFKAADAATSGDTFVTAVTATSADTEQFSPKHYAMGLVFDYSPTLLSIVQKIQASTHSGYEKLSLGDAITITMTDNVPQDVKAEVQDVVKKIISGDIDVKNDQSEVK
jgi:basic membrane protein A